MKFRTQSGLAYLLVIAMAALIIACSSKPDESVARQAHLQQFSDFQDVLRMNSFQKTNGEELGNNRYRIYYESEWEITGKTSGYTRRSPLSGLLDIRKVTRGFKWINYSERDDYNAIYELVGKPIPKGAKFKAEGYLNFRKTENGWVAEE